MGIPGHYSIELPERCLALIDALWPTVKTEDFGARFAGPLTTTFLLAMATPIIVLPVERIQKHLKRENGEGLADDRPLDPDVAKAIASAFSSGDAENLPTQFSQVPLFGRGIWSYEFSPRPFNLAWGLPAETAEALNRPEAADRAGQQDALEMVLALRNALAHGGVLYLNRHGHSTVDGQPVHFLAFVGEKRDRKRQLAGLHTLRASEGDFRECLRSWVGWLRDTRLSRDLRH